MADFVTNRITFLGDENEIKQLIDYMRADIDPDRVDFYNLRPVDNLYDVELITFNSYISDDYIEFETRWSPITMAVLKMSTMYPNLTFEYMWASETIGETTGSMKIKDGQCIEEYLPDNFSKEAYELAAVVMSDELEDMGYIFDKDTGTYKSIKEDDISMTLKT